MLDQNIKDFVFESIGKTPIETDPFPHLYVNNVFPADFYATLIEMMPSDEEYHESSSVRTNNAYSLKSRKRISLSKCEHESLGTEKRVFWDDLKEFLTSNEFTLLFVEKFKDQLLKRYTQLNTTTRLELLKDSTGYRISPHTDAMHKIFTILFYLPSSYTMRHLGTSIYTPKEKGFVNEEGIQLNFEEFDTYRKVDYLPNSIFCFMKTDNSFHGREPIVDQDVRRDLLNCSIQHAVQQ